MLRLRWLRMNTGKRKKIVKYLQKQHLAIVAAVISVSSLGLQLVMDWPQFSLLQFQGESVGLSLSHDHMNDHNGPRYIPFATDPAIDTVWDGEIDNTSTQAPLTISKWSIYAKTTSSYYEVGGV